MSPLAKAREFKEGFQKGFTEADSDPTRVPVPPVLDFIGTMALEVFRILLYGFILTSPGVNLIPWGEPAGIATALVMVAAVLAVTRFPNPPMDLALSIIMLGGVALVARTEPVSTSLLLVGAFVASITKIAKRRPVLYGLVAAVFLWGLLVDLFNAGPLARIDELILSGERFTHEGLARQTTLLAAIVFLAGLQQFAVSEMRREKERREAAEKARDEAAADERARIARELHDVVSHHVTAMTLQAEAAAATGDRKALESLATSGREAAAELRRMLGVLRRPAEGNGAEPPDPQPKLIDVDKLASRLSGGLEVNVRRTGEPRPLPAGVELCAYRVIQEALTNVAKHSDARRAEVNIDYSPRRLTLEILNDGDPVSLAGGGGGQGLIGMRERVALLDGTLEAGPREGRGGYRVFASVPL